MYVCVCASLKTACLSVDVRACVGVSVCATLTQLKQRTLFAFAFALAICLFGGPAQFLIV